MLQNRFKLRVWDPVLNKGAIWTYWKGAYRDTGKDEGATIVIQTPNKQGWFWYIPQHDDIVSVGVVAPFDYLFKGRGERTSRSTTRKSSAARRCKERIANGDARDRLLRDEGLLVSLEAGRRRRLGARRRRVRLSRSALFVGRAAGARSRASWPPTRSPTGSRRATLSAAQLGKWGADVQRRRRSHAAAGVRVLRRLQLRPVRARTIRTCKSTVTDLLDRRSVHRPRRRGLGADGIALSARQAEGGSLACRYTAGPADTKQNELFLPDGKRP